MGTALDLIKMNHSDVCGVVVTYHPDPGFPARLSSISSQVDAMVIVDNGSADAEVGMLRAASAQGGMSLILNSENLGIARALNLGVQQAAILGYRWILLLDQDSRVHDDLLDALLAVYDSFPEKEHLALIGSGYRDLRRELAKPSTAAVSGCRWDEVEAVITSGSLLSLAAYSDIGPFREDFFIDLVDNEYCIRAKTLGYRLINSHRPLMSHSVGAPTLHKWLWMTKLTTNHSADRCYYFARNDTVMLREYGSYKWGLWALKSFSRRFRTVKRIVLYEEAKADKVMAVIHGWWDGVHGTMGARKKKPALDRVSAKKSAADSNSRES
jgi:rhamnosyltransferase